MSFLLSAVLIATLIGHSARLSAGSCLGKGLLDPSTLRERGLLLGPHHQSAEKTQWIFASLQFNCDTEITAIHYATLNVSEQGKPMNMHPKFQVWRKDPMSPQTFTKHDIKGTVDTFNASTTNIFTHSVKLRQGAVRSGDILGAYQPALMKSKTFLTFQEDDNSGFMSYYKGNQNNPPSGFTTNTEMMATDVPLLSIQTAGQRCLSGLFPTTDLLTLGKSFQQPPILSSTATEHFNQQRLYPHLGFNCSGRIVNITFVALEGPSSATQYLELQIWHMESDSLYNKTQSVSLADAVKVELLNVYQVTLKEHLSFASGDVIGLYLPPERSSRYIIQFQPPPPMDATSLSYSSSHYQETNNIFEIGANHVQQDYDLPMIYLELGVVVCPPLSAPLHGEVSLTGREPGDRATYTCSSGFQLTAGGAAATHTCTTSGTWSGIKVKCEEIAIELLLEGNSTNGDNESTAITSTAVTDGSEEGLNAQTIAIFSVLSGVLFIVLCVLVVVTVICIRKGKQGANLSRNTGNDSFFRQLGASFRSNRRRPLTSSSIELGDSSEPHYERASDYYSSQEYEIPVSPYQIPLSSGGCGGPGPSESLYWDTYYVPTEKQRRTMSEGKSAPNLLLYSSEGTSCNSPTFFCQSPVYWKPASDSASLYEQLARNKYREIRRDQIQISSRLGSGNFGRVEKGVWHSPVGMVKVAVKLLKEDASENDRVKFLQEAAINGQFSHRNVVNLLGVVTVTDPVMMILELLVHGDLRKYLIKTFRPVPGEMVPPETPHLLLQFCQHVASGMEYLARKAFVHRDLAARNILVAEDKSCKIADFGLARDLEDEQYYVSHGGQIPVKWTAPEALYYKKYSTASDVWSYGVVMYEIWSLGQKPFEQYSNVEVVRVIDQGVRMEPPPGCPRTIYSMMIDCWHPSKDSRPNFSSLLQSLSKITLDLDTKIGWINSQDFSNMESPMLGVTSAEEGLFNDLNQAYLGQGSLYYTAS